MSGEGALVKMHRLDAFSRNVKNVNLKKFSNHGQIYKFERKFNKYPGERQSPKEFIEL